MLKTLLLGGALAMALPAFAQAPATHSAPNAGTTAPTAHNPLQTQDDATMRSTATPSTDAAVAGNVNKTSPGLTASLATPTDNCTLALARHSRRATRGRCARTGGGAVTAAAGPAGSMSAYTGMGGPDTGPIAYPPCSRTVTDRCTQTGRHKARR
ncbi:MAG TPA: hypothetical protein VFW19_05290 [Allosphingosinicella sp.]|nr:hypothetical protein [Allosphingosinicella sp.]